MSWLMEYFNDQRLSCAVGSNEGMFTLWKPYLPSLIALYEYISRHTIAAHELQLGEYNIEGKITHWEFWYSPVWFGISFISMTGPRL